MSAADQTQAAVDLISAYRPELVRRLTLIVRDPHEAEDLAQNASIRALEAWSREQVRNPRSWLFTIGIRLALNEVRRRRRFWLRPQPVREATVDVPDPDLWIALAQLTRTQRAALLMSVVDGYSYAEIAEALQVPTGTVASLISRAKMRLRGLLKEDERDG